MKPMKSLAVTGFLFATIALQTISGNTFSDAKSLDTNSPSESTLLRFDFDRPNAWPNLTAQISPEGASTVHASQEDVGTMDVIHSLTRSGGLHFVVQNTPNKTNWEADFSSGPLAIQTHESNLAKLTLAFSLSVSEANPITVQIESLDRKKQRTGGMQATIYPAAPDFYQRYALDLSTMTSVGKGKFSPTNPFVRLTVVLNGKQWSRKAQQEVCLDNVSYASPAYYVSPKGHDTNDGRTEKTAFATPQQALDVAQPGDIVLLMGGTYSRAQIAPTTESVAQFVRGGTPDAWIVLKNYPGQHPVLTSDSWSVLSISKGTRDKKSEDPALAYLEVRGLTIRGEADIAKTKYSDLVGKDDAKTNGLGIRVEGRYMANPPHHLRFADNIVEFCNATGFFFYNVDWLSVENNEIRDNCWTTVYEGSGLCLFGGADFTPTDGYKALVSGNRVSGNRCFLKSKYAGKVFNGNGIQIDANNDTPATIYQGRTLLQNNLVFNNGGVGIQMWGAHRLDIVNNTVYYNGVSPELRWGQIGVTFCDDVRLINNIVVAQSDRPLNTWYGATENKNTNIVRIQNLYFGGKTPPLPGDADVIADPQFVNPSMDADTADFHLKPSSPALLAGSITEFSPIFDIDGNPRSATPTKGAFEQ